MSPTEGTEMAKTETPTPMSTEDTLLAFSEWLDSSGLAVHKTSDNRTHEDLAREFIQHWESNPDRAVLAGRLGARVGKALREAADKIAAALEGRGDQIPGL